MRFSRLSKRTALLIAAQLACLALGIWFHGRLVMASAEWNRELQVGEDLAQTIRQALASEDYTAATCDFGMLVVTPQWRLKQAGGNANVTDAMNWAPDQPVAWLPTRRRLTGEGQPASGTLVSAFGPRPAVMQPLPNQQGYLIAYSQPIDVDPTGAVARALPAAGWLSLIWIGILQAALTYMVLARIRVEHTRLLTKSDEETLRRTKDLVRTRDAVIFGLAKLADSRDPETGQHLERISMYSTRLAAALRRYPEYREAITPSFLRLIGISSALHDIGKVGIGDDILLKPGPLTDEQFATMQVHTTIGGECLAQIERRLGTSNFLEMAREIAIAHHEQYDGSGYPNQLQGNDIPLPARIVALADVYDALASSRVYKDALPHEQCVRMIEEKSGTHFDPAVVRAFLDIEAEMKAIAQRYSEHKTPQTDLLDPSEFSAEALAEPVEVSV